MQANWSQTWGPIGPNPCRRRSLNFPQNWCSKWSKRNNRVLVGWWSIFYAMHAAWFEQLQSWDGQKQIWLTSDSGFCEVSLIAPLTIVPFSFKVKSLQHYMFSRRGPSTTPFLPEEQRWNPWNWVKVTLEKSCSSNRLWMTGDIL